MLPDAQRAASSRRPTLFYRSDAAHELSNQHSTLVTAAEDVATRMHNSAPTPAARPRAPNCIRHSIDIGCRERSRNILTQ